MSLGASANLSQSLHSLPSEESCLCVQNEREAPSFWSWVGVSLVEPLIIYGFFMEIPVAFENRWC